MGHYKFYCFPGEGHIFTQKCKGRAPRFYIHAHRDSSGPPPPLKNECSLRVLRAKFGTKIVSSGSHWRCEVVRHLCSQSESGWQMYFRPGHSPFGPQKDAFYRGQFVILTHVFAIVCPWNEVWNMRCCHYLPLSLKFKWRRNFGSRNKWQRDKRKIGEWVGFCRLLSFKYARSSRHLFFTDNAQFFCLLVRYAAKKICNFKFNLNVSSYSFS